MPRAAQSKPVAKPVAPARPRLVRRSPRSPAAPLALTHQQTAVRAYELFLERGATHGRDVEDWLTAERELLDAAVPVRAVRRMAGARA